MLFAQKMVAPIRLCRGKQGHLGWQCRRGDTQLAGSAGARRDSGVWGGDADPFSQGVPAPQGWVQDEPGCGSHSWETPQGWERCLCLQGKDHEMCPRGCVP